VFPDLDDSLRPYLPFLRVSLDTQSGTVGAMPLGEHVAPTGDRVTFKFLHQCWRGPRLVVLPAVPQGQNDLTMRGILANGFVAFVKRATVDFNCSHCDAGAGSPMRMSYSTAARGTCPPLTQPAIPR